MYKQESLFKTPNDLEKYLSDDSTEPLFLTGDSVSVLKKFPDASIDVIITSPPYYNQREYDNGGIGNEESYHAYIDDMLSVTSELFRVLKPTGSFWLNMGDTYEKKHLLGVPWRLAIQMEDEQGWIMRNEVIWNKVKGGLDNSKDRLGNVHEQLFYFVKQSKGYYYNADKIRKNPGKSKVVHGSVVSSTGVSGVRYKRQIELSTMLTSEQKYVASSALSDVLKQVENGDLADFRMVIKGNQRATHSNSLKLSGRAKELDEKGFYFLKYNAKGAKPRDVWDIIPEDTQKRTTHFAPFPKDLLRIPLLATLPESGIVLDPFSGTGTTAMVARELGCKAIGIDISENYIKLSEERLQNDEK